MTNLATTEVLPAAHEIAEALVDQDDWYAGQLHYQHFQNNVTVGNYQDSDFLPARRLQEFNPHRQIASKLMFEGSQPHYSEGIDATDSEIFLENCLEKFRSLAENALRQHQEGYLDSEKLADRIDRISLTLRRLHSITKINLHKANLEGDTEGAEVHQNIISTIRDIHTEIEGLVNTHVKRHDSLVADAIIQPFDLVKHDLCPVAKNDNNLYPAHTLTAQVSINSD